MAVSRFFVPSVVIRNITSSKTVRILQVPIKPGQTVDLYRALNVPIELFEFQIIKALEKPYGDLYVEQEIKGSIQILVLDLITFSYSKVAPANIIATNSWFPGARLEPISEDEFEWVPKTTVEGPLELSVDNVISLPPATGVQDGYLTKEDWLRFNASVKGALRIWQYQDFAAPAGGSVALSAFENGSGAAFNSSYIIDDTATVVLTSDSAKPPTTTLTFPGSILPGNRVTVSSHIGTTVVFNSSPDASLNVRVFYLISLPATVALPNDYQEDPEFLNDSSLDYLDDLYVNKNLDESIYGVKTFEGSVVLNSGLKFTTSPVAGYFLKSDALGNASWAAVAGGGGDGYVNALNDLTDVDLDTTPPFVGSLLGFDGYLWVPLEGRTMYNKEIDEITGGDIYIGEALPGTLTSEAKWRIQFVNFTKTGQLEDVSITWADGNALFDNIWNDRLSLSYS